MISRRMLSKALASPLMLALPMSVGLRGASAQTPAPVAVRVALTLSTSTIPLRYAEQKGIFAKHGVDVKLTQYADFDAVYISGRAGASDIISGGPAAIANLRSNGVLYKVAIGTTRMFNDILVSKDSGVHDLKDLKGKSIGIFGGAGGNTANMFMAVMIKQFGFDPRTDAKVVYGAAGLLAGLLAKGDIAAFVGNDPVTSIELASGRARSLGELGEIYASGNGGYRPFAGAFATSDSFAKQHPDGMAGFLDAWQETVKIFQADPTLWSAGLKELLQIDDPAVAKLVSDNIYFAPEWTQRNVKGEMAALEFIKASAGKGFLDTIPDDTFVMPSIP